MHSPAISSVTTFMLSKAGYSEAGGVVRMAVFGLVSLQVLVPRQFAVICHSVNVEWGVCHLSQCQRGVGCHIKTCGCDRPSQLRKSPFSNFRTS